MMIKKIILFLLLVCAAGTTEAQSFWGFPQQRMERRREPYTAPAFKGGEKGIKAFVLKNFKQPSERERVDGQIVVAVIVNEKGKPAETHVVRSVNETLNAEAVRVCRKMKFKPATLGKKKVKGRVDITFPVRHGRLSYSTLPTIEV